MRKYADIQLDITDKKINDAICKELTNGYIIKKLLPKFKNEATKPFNLMPHHLFEIFYPVDHIQEFESRMFSMRDVLYEKLSDQLS